MWAARAANSLLRRWATFLNSFPCGFDWFVLSGTSSQTMRLRVRDLWSLGFILFLVATVIPFQVAFLVCFLIHLSTCAAQAPSSSSNSSGTPGKNDMPAQKVHFLLLLFWLLPFTAPVLAVWARTLLTAGLTTPFDGDHNIAAIASFLLYTNLAATTQHTFDRATSRYEFNACIWLSSRFLFCSQGREVHGNYFTVRSGCSFVCGWREIHISDLYYEQYRNVVSTGVEDREKDDCQRAIPVIEASASPLITHVS